jgi:signal peptidase
LTGRVTTARRALTVGAKLLLVAAVLSLVAGQVLGQPMLLSYVETGSMEPTLSPGDGFVAVPAAVDGDVEEGDVIVFRAEEIDGGGLTTHRVVDETDEGYVTKGDANPFTDQDSGEPPVKDEQIVATALQVNGEVVVVPGVGAVVEGVQSVLTTVQRQAAALLGTRSLLGVQGLAYLFFAASLVVYAVGEWRAGGQRARDRSRSRETGTDSRLLVGGFAALIVLAATATMVVPAGPQEYGVVSAEFDSENPRVVPAGESANRTYVVANGGTVPVLTVLEPGSDAVEVTPRRAYVGGGERVNATVTVDAPPETGAYRRYVVEHRYLAVLPPSVLLGLYEVHPWLPIVAVDAVLGLPFYLVGITVVGRGRVRTRRRERRVSVVTRLRRAVRGRN